MLIKEVTDPHELNKFDIKPDDPRYKLYRPTLKKYAKGSKLISDLLHKKYREVALQPITQSNFDKNKEEIQMLDDIMFNHSIKQDITLYHGLIESPLRIWDKYNVPRNKPVRVHMPGFTSTTTLFKAATWFTRVDAKYQTLNMLKIKVPAGTPGLSIKSISHLDFEDEILLTRGLDIVISPKPNDSPDDSGNVLRWDNTLNDRKLYRILVWDAKVVGVNPQEITE